VTKRPQLQDAFKYGVQSSYIVLPWESEDEFKELHENLRGEFFPDGPMEEETVYEIARWQWVKRRLTIGAQSVFRGPNSGALLEAAKNGGWEGVFEHLHQNNAIQPILTELHRLIGTQVSLAASGAELLVDRVKAFPERVKVREEEMKESNVQLSEAVADTSSHEQFLSPQELAEAIARYNAKRLAEKEADEEDDEEEEEPDHEVDEFQSLLEQFAGALTRQADFIDTSSQFLVRLKEFDNQQTLLKSGTRPDQVDEVLRTEAEINKQIDKLFMRLNQLKSYKKSWIRRRVRSPPRQL
jgi:hypothetical protein